MDEDGLVELLHAAQPGARAVTIVLTRPPQLLSLGPTATRILSLAETLEIELPAAASARSSTAIVLDWSQIALVLYSVGPGSGLPIPQDLRVAPPGAGATLAITADELSDFAAYVVEEQPDAVFVVFFDPQAKAETVATTLEKLRRGHAQTIYRATGHGFELIGAERDRPRPGIDLPPVDATVAILHDPHLAGSEDPAAGGDLEPPAKIHGRPPRYPEAAHQARIEGQVILRALIDRQGNVTNVEVLQGLATGLDEEAVAAIEQWKFQPATLNGEPVDVHWDLAISFRLGRRLEGPIYASEDVRPPGKIHGPQPRYTEAARKARVQGEVIVRAIIDRRGDVARVEVVQGLSMGLDEETVAAIRQWKFRPATLNGEPVNVIHDLTVNFRLQ